MPQQTSTTISRRKAPAESTARARSTTAAGGRARTTTTTKSSKTVFGGREPTVREIRDRAYYIYLARGGVEGDPVDDWVRAERELREELHAGTPSRRRF